MVNIDISLDAARIMLCSSMLLLVEAAADVYFWNITTNKAVALKISSDSVVVHALIQRIYGGYSGASTVFILYLFLFFNVILVRALSNMKNRGNSVFEDFVIRSGVIEHLIEV